MSKATELAIISRSRSINAPVGVNQRSGERESVGEMLDMYVYVQSAEDEYLENEENARKELFLKGFRLYVKKLYTEEERRFLSALMGKKVTLERLFRNMKFGEFRELKRLQEKAQANIGILKKLSELSGWSGSEEFIGEFFARMERVQGCERSLNALAEASISKRLEAHRKYINEYRKDPRHRESHRMCTERWRARPEVKARQLEIYRAYSRRPEVKERRKEYYKEYSKRPEFKERKKEYNRRFREKSQIKKSNAHVVS